MTDRKGQCMCGAVRINALDMVDDFSICYCKTCQRWAGGPFKGASVKFDKLEIDGTNEIGTYQSSHFAERTYCTNSGSSIWFRLTNGKYAGNTSIALGVLDDTEGMRLTSEYFTDYKNSTDAWTEAPKQFIKAEIDSIIADFMDGEE